MRSNSQSHPTEELPLFLPHAPNMEGGSDRKYRSLPLKIRRLEIRLSAPIEVPYKQSPPAPEPCNNDWCIVTDSSQRLTYCANYTPEQRKFNHHLLPFRFLHPMKRRKEYMATQQRNNEGIQKFSEEMAEFTLTEEMVEFTLTSTPWQLTPVQMKQDHKTINCIPCNIIELANNLESTAGIKVAEISARCLLLTIEKVWQAAIIGNMTGRSLDMMEH